MTKKLVTIFSLALAMSQQLEAQTYYPLPSPCDPDKVFILLPNAAYDNNCVFNLDLRNMNYNRFPSEIYRYPNLKHLNLIACKVPELPIDITNLLELQTLDLSDNSLKSLPSTIGQLKKLKRLILKNNQLKELPTQLANLTQLEEIDITGNPMVNLPSVLATLPNLKIIKVGAFQIKDPIAYLNTISNSYITHLDLSNTGLNYVPAAISKFKNLRELNLSNNNIVGVAEEIFNLTKLERLDLSHNKIEELPRNFGYCSSLRSVDLSQNRLGSLPDTYTRLRLNAFNFDGNNFNTATQRMLSGLPPEVAPPAVLNQYIAPNELIAKPVKKVLKKKPIKKRK